jgi:hypothetical protein
MFGCFSWPRFTAVLDRRSIPVGSRLRAALPTPAYQIWWLDGFVRRCVASVIVARKHEWTNKDNRKLC